MPVNVLHICSDYAKQRIYLELVANLSRAGVSQSVYVPVRSEQELGKNSDPGLHNVSYYYSHILRPMHRLLFRRKIDTVTRNLLQSVDPALFSLVHAHFLFSDGAVALRLNECYLLPYVVAVRNTDLNAFMRLRPDLRAWCWRIVAAARHVIFPTPAYIEQLARYATSSVAQMLRQKARIVPNGLGDYWLEHAGREPRAGSGATLRLLYVGDFSKNKNLLTTIHAAASIARSRAVTLTLVGGGGDGEAEVLSLLESRRYPFLTHRGRIADREQLRQIYQEHDIFVMPSLRETFGVVYLEALSQGTPVIFTRAQGVDGYFPPGTVGEAVDPLDVSSVERGILALAGRLDSIRPQCFETVRRFGWPRIAGEYIEIYADTTQSARRTVA